MPAVVLGDVGAVEHAGRDGWGLFPVQGDEAGPRSPCTPEWGSAAGSMSEASAVIVFAVAQRVGALRRLFVSTAPRRCSASLPAELVHRPLDSSRPFCDSSKRQGPQTLLASAPSV